MYNYGKVIKKAEWIWILFKLKNVLQILEILKKSKEQKYSAD